MLMVELVTPCSVAPVAVPLPQGDGSVPNVAVEDDDAPPVAGASSTPVAVSEKSNRAAPTALVPVNLAMANPRSHSGFCAWTPPEPRSGFCVLRHHTNRTSRILGAPNKTVTRVEVGPPRAKAQDAERPLRRLADWSMTASARLLVRVFFRSIEVEDGENLPETGPVVLVANHTNGLVD